MGSYCRTALCTTRLRANSNRRHVRSSVAVLALAVLGVGAAYGQGQLEVSAGLANARVVGDGLVYDFGDVALGADRHAYFTLGNGGDAVLTLTGSPVVAIGGTDAGYFVVNEQPARSVLVVGGEVLCNIGFRPDEVGEYVAQVTIGLGGAEYDAFEFTISGRCVAAPVDANDPVMRVFQLRDDYTFGKMEIEPGDVSALPPTLLNEQQTIEYAIENHGGAQLELTGNPAVKQTSGSTAIQIANQPAASVIPPAGSGDPADNALIFSVRFSPSNTNQQTANFTIGSNEAGQFGASGFIVFGIGIEEDDGALDCNGNNVVDADDIASGASFDCNTNGVPDECEHDSDGDGVIDDCDVCPGERDRLDTDRDGVPDCLDNCPDEFNPAQNDADGDGIGNACDDVIDDNPDNDNANDNSNDNANDNGSSGDPPTGGCGAMGLGTTALLWLGLTGLRRRTYA